MDVSLTRPLGEISSSDSYARARAVVAALQRRDGVTVTRQFGGLAPAEILLVQQKALALGADPGLLAPFVQQALAANGPLPTAETAPARRPIPWPYIIGAGVAMVFFAAVGIHHARKGTFDDEP